MKISLKHKLVFSLYSGLSFAILNSLMSYFIMDEVFRWEKFVLNLLFFGLLFGFGYWYVMQIMSAKLLSKIDVTLTEGETVKYEGGANLFRGVEGVGGKLVLTDQRLIFKSHKFNLQSGETQIPVEEIREVKPRKTAKLFQNGIRVLTQSGDAYDFVVYERDSWLQKLMASQATG